MSAFDKRVYFGTVMCRAPASIVLIAATVHHRLVFGEGDKEQIVGSAYGPSIAGLAGPGVPMSAAILLIANTIFGAASTVVATASTVVATASIVAGFAVVWYGLPVGRRAGVREPGAGG